MGREKAKLDAIISAYESGKSLREVANMYHITFQAVHQRLVRYGIPLRPKSLITRLLLEKLCPVCGTHFFTKRADAIYCSHPCSSTAKRGMQRTHCKHGHPLIENNLYPRYSSTTPPRCKICCREAQRAYKKRLRQHRPNSNAR